MGFASTYLENRALFPQLIKGAPDNKTSIIVVVPSYNEPGITDLLDSLALCNDPYCKVEVLIVVNAPANAGEDSLANNRKTILNIENWKKNHSNCFFRLYTIDATSFVINGWGVGLARKTGMDEAVRRFNFLDRPDGVILNLDADCTVAKNYFSAVNFELLKRKDRSACSIYFEHPISGNDFSEMVYTSIILYELHLRFYFQGLKYSCFPYVYHTVGSAVAVKALPYIKAGGMNRRIAGEDFYFIQKLIPAGGYFNLNTTAVYPSPRSSFRVPFGTGATIAKLTTENHEILLTYNMQSFNELKSLFGMTVQIYNCKSVNVADSFSDLPEGLKLFIGEEEWTEKILEIKGNTSGLQSFQKRFFGWFNMFKIVKYLNHSHSGTFKKTSVVESALELLNTIGNNFRSNNPRDILLYYRKLEKET